MTVRVMVTATMSPVVQEAFEAAFLRVAELMRGTPGLLAEELLRDIDRPGHYILLSEWENEEIFRAWESSDGHHQTTAPMRPFWSGSFDRRIYHAGRLDRDEVPQPA